MYEFQFKFGTLCGTSFKTGFMSPTTVEVVLTLKKTWPEVLEAGPGDESTGAEARALINPTPQKRDKLTLRLRPLSPNKWIEISTIYIEMLFAMFTHN